MASPLRFNLEKTDLLWTFTVSSDLSVDKPLVCKCNLLFFISGRSVVSAALVGHGVSGNNHPCIRVVSGRLLQLSSCGVETDKLKRVLNSAARIVSNTRKYDRRLSRLLHDELHWLDVTDSV